MSQQPAGNADSLLESMLSDFLDESGQLLVRLNEHLLQVDEWVHSLAEGETAQCDAFLMNDMFRAAHSLKGLSAMLGLAEINALTHKVENVFDAARNDELRFDKPSVELMFQSVDRLGEMIEHLKDPSSSPPGYGELSDKIHTLLSKTDRNLEMGSQADVEAHLRATLAESAAPSCPVRPPAPRADLFASIVDESDVPAKYLGIFIDETDLSLDSFTETLIQDGGMVDRAGTESLMIISHRIKGSAASVGLNRAAKLAHCMEDLLQERLERGVDLTAETIDVLLRCADALRRYVDGLKIGAPDTTRFSGAYCALLDLQLETPIKVTQAPAPVAEKAPQPARLTREELNEIRRSASTASAGVVGRVRFQSDFPLIGLKARLVYERLARLGELFHCEPSAETLENCDQLEFLRFGLATDAELADVAAQLHIVGVVDVEIEPLTSANASQSPAPVTADALAPAAAAPESKSNENRPAETLRVDIERLDQLMSLAGQLVINKARFIRIGEGLKQTTGNKRLRHRLGDVFTQLERLDGALEQGEASTGPAELPLLRNQVRLIQRDLDVLRVELDRLASARNTINDLFDAVHQLDRVAEGIQRTVMDTRMVPIGPLFGRFRRVVRDITRSNGKDIRLEIHGEKTELDKRMIDELGDPLIHMVRNSADHGVESPQTRVAAGKPAQGVITLNAFHRGNRIVIQVLDDGKGLDAERIRKKALERELVAPADLERMTLHQVYNLIWEPGFSTAETVTEISGRGMGMDIVKSKIEELNGTVEVDSVPGQGATFTIKLPLTMAILPSLMAEVSGGVFAFPIESVVEIVRFGADKLNSVQGVPTATVRGRVISVVQLDELFTWNEEPRAESHTGTNDITMVILGSEGRELGLKVDHLLGEEDIVIKSLADNYRHVPGIAGASILGDGRVALILDIAGLVDTASRRDDPQSAPKETIA
jgi:two-component system chemotaxis sensor kinase CheA